MPSTYTPIATQTVSSSVSSVTFSSIPQVYTDLIIVINGTSNTYTDLYYTFNADTGTNYSRTYFYGSGTTAISGGESNYSGIPISFLNTITATSVVHFMNYFNMTTYKTAIGRAGATNYTSLWRSTAAISSMTLTTVSATISPGTTFVLYGIKAA